jgi:hypothetical protein
MLHIRPKNMCIAETFRHVKMSVPPNSRSFHAVGGPFTLIQADSRSDSRAQKLCKHVEQRNHGNHFLFYLRVTTKIKFGLAGRWSRTELASIDGWWVGKPETGWATCELGLPLGSK